MTLLWRHIYWRIRFLCVRSGSCRQQSAGINWLSVQLKVKRLSGFTCSGFFSADLQQRSGEWVNSWQWIETLCEQGFTSHRPHCRLLSSGCTNEAFMGHSLKPRTLKWSGLSMGLCFYALGVVLFEPNMGFRKRVNPSLDSCVVGYSTLLKCSQTSSPHCIR